MNVVIPAMCVFSAALVLVVVVRKGVLQSLVNCFAKSMGFTQTVNNQALILYSHIHLMHNSSAIE
jgi:hypothetical protein